MPSNILKVSSHSACSLIISILYGLFLLFLQPYYVIAQKGLPDSLIQLQAVEIKSFSLEEKKAGFHVDNIDSLTIAQYKTADLGKLLAYQSPIFLKFYSVSGLATPSFRGTSAGHTQVYWQGIPLNSPTLGQVDFSLFPIGLLDQVDVYYGGASLRYGEGGFGGGIALNQQQPNTITKPPNALQWIQSYGSFQKVVQILKASYSLHPKGKIRAVSRAFFKRAKNNYPYFYKGKKVIRKRAKTRQEGLVQEFYFLPNTKHQFSANVWLQQAKRELPPPLTVAISEENQEDFSMRHVLTHQYKKPRWSIQSSVAYIYDKLRYQNLLATIASQTQTHSFHGFSEIKYAITNKLLWQTGIRWREDKVSTGAFDKVRHQSKQSIFTSLEYSPFQILELSFVGRQVMLDEQLQDFLPALGAQLTLNNWVIKTNISRNFRAPTLNDKYWFPVGNPALRNEKGFSGELSNSYTFFKQKGIRASVAGVYFFAHIKDWILWSPGVGGYWRPENLREVVSQGIENSLSLEVDKKLFALKAKLWHTYTNSKNLKAIRNLDASKGKQLIYTPFHQQKAYLSFSMKNYFVSTEELFVGRRFTTTSNTQFLPSYFLFNFSVGKSFKIRKSRFLATFNLDNAFNYQYQSMAFYPMVGRSFALELRASI